MLKIFILRTKTQTAQNSQTGYVCDVLLGSSLETLGPVSKLAPSAKLSIEGMETV